MHVVGILKCINYGVEDHHLNMIKIKDIALIDLVQ
jgi:hypothetical protein